MSTPPGRLSVGEQVILRVYGENLEAVREEGLADWVAARRTSRALYTSEDRIAQIIVKAEVARARTDAWFPADVA